MSSELTGLWHSFPEHLWSLEQVEGVLQITNCPGRRGRLSAISVFLCESVLYGAFVLARMALKHQKRRFPARAVHRLTLGFSFFTVRARRGG